MWYCKRTIRPPNQSLKCRKSGTRQQERLKPLNSYGTAWYAVDFDLMSLYRVDPTAVAIISETHKMMRPTTPVEVSLDNKWLLKSGCVYDGTSSVYVNIPAGVAAVLYTRSTFVRNGVFIVSGLYDSGYKGQIGFTIYPIGGDTIIEVGTRIGQIAFVKSDNATMYAGQYNHDQGTHWTSVAKELEQTHKVSSDQVRPQAGKQSFF